MCIILVECENSSPSPPPPSLLLSFPYTSNGFVVRTSASYKARAQQDFQFEAFSWYSCSSRLDIKNLAKILFWLWTHLTHVSLFVLDTPLITLPSTGSVHSRIISDILSWMFMLEDELSIFRFSSFHVDFDVGLRSYELFLFLRLWFSF